MDVISDVREYITGELLQRNDLQIADDTALIEDGYLTSLQTVELIMFLEEKFDIEIDPTEVDEENFRTLNDIAALVERNQA